MARERDKSAVQQAARVEIDRELVERVRRQAAEQGRSERGLIEEMLEESIRVRRLPGIAFRGWPTGRRAWVLGTPFDVWAMMELYRGRGRERFIEEHGVSEERLDVALAYYKAYPDEIDQRVAANARNPAEWHRLSLGHTGSCAGREQARVGTRPARMKLMLDAHLSGRAVGKALVESGHDVRALDSESVLEGMEDPAVLRP